MGGERPAQVSSAQPGGILIFTTSTCSGHPAVHPQSWAESPSLGDTPAEQGVFPSHQPPCGSGPAFQIAMSALHLRPQAPKGLSHPNLCLFPLSQCLPLLSIPLCLSCSFVCLQPCLALSLCLSVCLKLSSSICEYAFMPLCLWASLCFLLSVCPSFSSSVFLLLVCVSPCLCSSPPMGFLSGSSLVASNTQTHCVFAPHP